VGLLAAFDTKTKGKSGCSAFSVHESLWRDMCTLSFLTGMWESPLFSFLRLLPSCVSAPLRLPRPSMWDAAFCLAAVTKCSGVTQFRTD
jgi:hypothetical protein